MNRYRITSNYGTFVISRIVEAADEDEAWAHTGIMETLTIAGWDIVSSPDGEEHEIELLP